MVSFKKVTLDTVCDVLNGDRGINYPSSSDLVLYGIPFINAGAIENRKINFKKVDFITESKYNSLSGAKFEKGDIVFCLRGSLGKYAMLKIGRGAPASSLAVLRCKSNSLNNKFLFQLLGSEIIEKQILSENNGSSQPNLSAESVKRFLVPLPGITEQIAISEALSDVDRLISSLQNLIEKKKAIKQGTMQELLTGKKRLPGFYGEWKHGVWKDVLAGFYSGATPYRGRADYYKGNIRWVSSGELNYNIIKDTIEHISEKAKSETSLIAHPAGTFLMAITGLEAAGTRGSCAILGKDATTNQSCMAIYGTDKMVIPYLYHYYLLNGEELAFQYCQGTKQQSYTAAIVKELPIYYPCDIVEQQAIAQVLSDMDSEIEQLEKKLVKYQQIKQGMMQELLTGRIRLVDADGKEQPKAQILQEKQSQPAHNQHFDDAVMIAGIVNAFYSEKYPLGRKKVQKLLYLVRRKEQADISAFHKKAAGPYADEVRYKGGEPIAQKNKYIQVKRNEKGSRFEKGVQVQQALAYLQDWGKQADIDWLVSQFQYTSVNELELLTTVDMAICDLHREGKEISVASIKDLIRSNKEWRDKLKKTYFRDSDIQRAIKKCEDLFES